MSASARGSASMRRVCCVEHGGVGEAALRGEAQQFLVRDAAPEEERQPRRQLEVADAVDRAGAQARRLLLEAVDELRIDEDARERVLDAGLEAAQRVARLVEPEQHVDGGSFSLTGRRIACVASDERMRRAHAISSGDCGRVAPKPEGEGGRHTKMRRRLGVSPGPVGFSGPLIPRLFTPAVLASSAKRSSTPRALRSSDDGDADGVRTGRHLQLDAAARRCPADQLHALAVERDLDLVVARRRPAGRRTRRRARPTRNSYSRVERKDVRHQQSAARAERQPFAVRRPATRRAATGRW